jgi:hemoglobin-like flavoprotein
MSQGASPVSLDVTLLRDSFQLIVDREPAITARFYRHLFADYPKLRPLFHRSRPEVQERMLAEALVAVLDHLEDAPWLQSTLFAMGKKHVEYGVTDEMYGCVGASLLKTFAEVAGSDWSPAAATAWTAAYDAIAGMMKAGAKLA